MENHSNSQAEKMLENLEKYDFKKIVDALLHCSLPDIKKTNVLLSRSGIVLAIDLLPLVADTEQPTINNFLFEHDLESVRNVLHEFIKQLADVKGIDENDRKVLFGFVATLDEFLQRNASKIM